MPNQYPDPHYQWDEWFSQPNFTLERGRHFTCQPHAMMIMTRNQARTRRVRVSVKIAEQVLIVTLKGPAAGLSPATVLT